CGRLRAAVEIHGAVFRAGDPDLACGGAEAAALAAVALALSWRGDRVCDVLAGHHLECRTSLGLVPEADLRAHPRRGFSTRLSRRVDSDPDRVRNALCLHPR